MTTKFAAALAVCAAFAVTPALAQQKPPAGEAEPPALTKADAQKIVDAIKADKSKTKDFCDLNALQAKFEAAEKKKDQKALDALDQQQEELGKRIGLEAAPDEQAGELLDATAKSLCK